MSDPKVPAGLYVHFPFCRTKCPYCHFYSLPFRKDLFESWLNGLKAEAGLQSSSGLVFDTLYIGGGTPSLLEAGDIFRVLEALGGGKARSFREFTLEANPGAGDTARLREWRDAGVDRLSIGVQSFDDRVLETLGRDCTGRKAAAFIERTRAAGFGNVGLDLMIGVPTETESSLRKTLKRVGDLRPEHVSLYILENIEGLPFEMFARAHPPEEDAGADAYDFMRAGLEEMGLRRYEISNFAREGRECLHNLKYWRYDPFLGLGPAACSHIGSVRWCNRADLGSWASALAGGGDFRDDIRKLSPRERLLEALVFGLRLIDGIRISVFKKKFGVDVREAFRGEIEELRGEGLLILDGDGLRIPEEKFLISNAVFSRFV